MLIRDNDGTVSTIEDFAQEMNDPCASIDYEFLAETAEAMVQIAFIQIMLNKFIE